MCIICNCGDDGDDFLMHFSAVKQHMRLAAEAMLRCSKLGNKYFQPGHASRNRQRYDQIHKKIVKMRKEWNKIEHEREC